MIRAIWDTIKAALFDWSEPVQAPVFHVAAAWTGVDRDRLSDFLASDTGQSLVRRLKAFEAQNAIAGAKDVLHTQHAAGRSVGYGDCIQHLLSLARVADQDTEQNWEPQQVHALDEFEARLSP